MFGGFGDDDDGFGWGCDDDDDTLQQAEFFLPSQPKDMKDHEYSSLQSVLEENGHDNVSNVYKTRLVGWRAGTTQKGSASLRLELVDAMDQTNPFSQICTLMLYGDKADNVPYKDARFTQGCILYIRGIKKHTRSDYCSFDAHWNNQDFNMECFPLDENEKQSVLRDIVRKLPLRQHSAYKYHTFSDLVGVSLLGSVDPTNQQQQKYFDDLWINRYKCNGAVHLFVGWKIWCSGLRLDPKNGVYSVDVLLCDSQMQGVTLSLKGKGALLFCGYPHDHQGPTRSDRTNLDVIVEDGSLVACFNVIPSRWAGRTTIKSLYFAGGDDDDSLKSYILPLSCTTDSTFQGAVHFPRLEDNMTFVNPQLLMFMSGTSETFTMIDGASDPRDSFAEKANQLQETQKRFDLESIRNLLQLHGFPSREDNRSASVSLVVRGKLLGICDGSRLFTENCLQCGMFISGVVNINNQIFYECANPTEKHQKGSTTVQFSPVCILQDEFLRDINVYVNRDEELTREIFNIPRDVILRELWMHPPKLLMEEWLTIREDVNLCKFLVRLKRKKTHSSTSNELKDCYNATLLKIIRE